jgi:hypothetical protein
LIEFYSSIHSSIVKKPDSKTVDDDELIFHSHIFRSLLEMEKNENAKAAYQYYLQNIRKFFA